MSDQAQLFHIVVVDDELEICEVLQEFLEKHSFLVTIYTDSKKVAANIETDAPDLLITDYTMPELNGLELAKIVKTKTDIPIIMFTAVDDPKEKIQALETVIDDYLVKPFNLRVLLARIKSLLRRSRFNKKNLQQSAKDNIDYTVFVFDKLILNTKQRLLTHVDGHNVQLGTAEFDILEVLIKSPQKILSRDEILADMDKVSFGADDRRVDVHVSRLRQKLESNTQIKDMIKTVRGKGYLFSLNVLAKNI